MPHDRKPGQDAVCFTAGPKGAPFSAGVIHAYLAADRPAPKVAAGISMGGLSAAALERCYRELSKDGEEDREVRRWNWFRRYLDTITCAPLDVIWNAIPDPIDFFADKPPVSDLSVRSLPEALQQAEQESRESYYRLVKLGLWLAGLRVSVRDVARCLVMWVRFKERYGYWVLQAIRFYVGCAIIILKALGHLCLSPQFIIERPLKRARAWYKWLNWLPEKWLKRVRRVPVPRPLFGWPAWIVSVAIALIPAYAGFKQLIKALPAVRDAIDVNVQWLSTVLGFFGAGAGFVAKFLPILKGLPGVVQRVAAHNTVVLWIVGAFWLIGGVSIAWFFFFRSGTATRYLLMKLGIARGLLHPYQLHRKLFELFREGPLSKAEPKIGSPNKPDSASMHLLIVAAPLQRIDKLQGQQVWAAPSTPLVDALLAALAAPGLFPPVQLDKAAAKPWLRMDHLPERVDLIDGAAVRQNPLPALFAWLKMPEHHAIANKLCGENAQDAGIHLVYNVPIEPYKADPEKRAPESVDIVTAAFASLELSRRRDTKLEWRQTNFLSEIELWIRKTEAAPLVKAVAQTSADATVATEALVSSGSSTSSKTSRPSYTAFPIFADEIAPEADIEFDNYLAPRREQALKVAAEGCRRSLENLYREQLRGMAGGKRLVPCAHLLREVAPERKSAITDKAPGLSEVCAACTRKLVPREFPRYAPKELEAAKFPNLSAERSRIAFVASGGVFRGAFHIGVIGAMKAAGIQPDLIVGASVGSLMGGALGAISKLDHERGCHLLAELCLTFLHVDERIALTRTLKNASKQLGIRTRCVNLSPAQLRKMVRRGTRSDAGYAVTGAPPALIDSISTVFLIPHGQTREIASEFVAGHITAAMKMFWSGVRSETLRRLDIETALMGTTLIESAARTLLGDGHPEIQLNTTQPYHPEISFFGTTSDLNQRRALLLSRDLDNIHSYDFIRAGLSSSAFPVVFSPRQEAEVLPGTGSTNVLFSDGGMFDNLPFFPAIEVLGSVQWQWRKQLGETATESLQRRSDHPDLFIAAALESEGEPTGNADDAIEIYRRAANLKVNIKLNSFRETAELVDAQTRRLLEVSHDKVLPEGVTDFMDRVVAAAVLKIAPADREHLNRTFAFCSALGMKQDVVAKSIADGCFQTLESLAQARSDGSKATLEHRAVASLEADGRIHEIQRHSAKADKIHCPFFTIKKKGSERAGAFECPFVSAAKTREADETDAASEVQAIYTACAGDSVHRARRN